MQYYRRAHAAAAVLLAAALGGCGTYQQGGVVRGGGINTEVPVTEAFVTPPPGGPAVIAVLENRYTNGLAQDIILENGSSNAGQNVIIVRAYGPMGRDAGLTDMESDSIELTGIRRELQRQFPGVNMEISGLYAQNKYGPFSYAVGRSRTGANCVYAWQRIAAEAKVFTFQRGAISWRMRVCDDNTDARTILMLAYGLTINGYFLSDTWNPYRLPEPDPRIGAPGVAILPEQVVDPTVIAPTSFGEGQTYTVRAPSSGSRRAVRAASPRPRRVASRPAYIAASTRQPAQPTVLNQPVEGAAIVPRPENTDLSEPTVRDSNLPQTGTAPVRPRLSVPTPPAAQGLSQPTPVRPAPAAASTPRLSTSGNGPSVRIVGPAGN